MKGQLPEEGQMALPPQLMQMLAAQMPPPPQMQGDLPVNPAILGQVAEQQVPQGLPPEGMTLPPGLANQPQPEVPGDNTIFEAQANGTYLVRQKLTDGSAGPVMSVFTPPKAK